MTLTEARYIIAHRHQFTTDAYGDALDLIEATERETP